MFKILCNCENNSLPCYQFIQLILIKKLKIYKKNNFWNKIILKKIFTKKRRVLFLLIIFSSIISCANVKPFQREFLADPIMQTSDSLDESVYENHMLRALTQGLVGEQTGGGGCGCEQ